MMLTKENEKAMLDLFKIIEGALTGMVDAQKAISEMMNKTAQFSQKSSEILLQLANLQHDMMEDLKKIEKRLDNLETKWHRFN